MKKITNYLNEKQGGKLLAFGLLLLLLMIGFNANAQTTATFNVTTNFVTPAGVTTATVEAWGAGGAGGGSTSNSDGGGGGGGGAYSKVTGTAVSGTMTVTVGVGGVGDTGAGNAGTDSSFNSVVVAKGGVGGSVTSGTGGPGGAGGLSTTSTGTTKFAGGTGGRGRDSNSGSGGPGGSSAGTAANGNSGAGTWANTTAITAPTGGGNGGAGGGPGTDGSAGSAPGGGGGGAGDSTNNGGNGAAGRVVLTYNCPTYSLTSATTATGPFCGASASVVTLTSTSVALPNGTYTVTYNLTGGNTATGSTATVTVASGVGTFTTAVLNPSATPTTVTITNLTSGVVSFGACSNAISTNNTVAIVVSLIPTAAAGSALTTCSTSGAVTLNSTGTAVTNNTGITWSTPNGTGSFANATNLTTATYTPSAADITAGSVTITLTATGSSPCANATNSKTLTINTPPTGVSAGDPVSTCASAGAITISTGATASNYLSVQWTGAGTFTNSTSLTGVTYNPTAGEKTAGSALLTLTAVAKSGCTNVIATKTLTIVPAATANAGTAIVTCSTTGAVNITAGSSASNASSVIWSTSDGTGTFANANSLTNATYTPSAADITAGSRTLVLTAVGNSPCGNITANKTISISQPPTAVAGNAVSTCSYSGAVNITSGASTSNATTITWSTTDGTGTFANANNISTATYTPSAADIAAGSVTIRLTASNAGCASASTTKTLTITSPPAAPGTITGTATVCAGVAGLSYSIASVPAATLYTWSVPTGWTITSGQGTTTITVTSGSSGQNGSVSVIASNSCGSTNPSQTVVANINPVDATNNTGSTTNTTKTDGNLTVSSSSSGTVRYGYLKFPLTALPAGTVVTASTLSLVNNGSGALSGVTNDVNAINLDPVSATASSIFSAVPSGTSYSSSTWNNTGTIALTLNATAVADIQSKIASGYIAMGLERGAGSSVYVFTGHAGGTNAPKLTVTYTEPRNIAVMVNAVATAVSGTNVVTCANGVPVNITAGSSASNNAGTTWSSSGTGTFANANSLTTATYSPSVADSTLGSVTLTLTATGNSGCSNAVSSKTLTINPTPTATAPSNQVYCAGVATSAIALTGTPIGVTFDISGGATIGLANASGITAIPSFNPIAGSATISITPKANGCTGTAVTYTILVNPTPTAVSPGARAYCTGTSAAAITLSGTPVGVTFDISGGAAVGLADVTGVTAVPSFTTITGSATVTITPKANGCTGSAVTYVITVNPVPTATAPADAVYCAGVATSAITLSGTPVGVTFDISGGAAVGLSNATGLTAIPSFSPIAGSATITLTPKANGCSGSAVTYNILVNPTPTAVSPGPHAYCTGVTASAITLSGTPSGVTFDISGGAAVGLNDVSGVTAVPSFTTIAGTATITITPNANGCTGTAVTYVITVNAVPTVTAPANQNYCNGAVTSPIGLSGSPSGVVYDISGGAAIGLNDGTGVTEIPSFTAILGSATVTITPRANGCTGNAVTYTITVNPLITPTFSPVAAICSGGSLSALPTTSNNGITGTWSPALNNTSTTTYTFTPTAGQCTPVSLTTLEIVVNTNTTYYADTDLDGYGDANNTIQTCLGLQPGYVTNNTDCNDNDHDVYRNGSLYVDFDGDSYNDGTPAASVCYGATVPVHYVAENNGTDCNDFNAEVNIWHEEVAGNLIDDNCDGHTDEVGQTSYIIPAQCGSTLSAISNTIYAYSYPEVTGYRFEITNGATVRKIDSNINSFSLANLPGGATYGTAYTIRVSVQTNGFWQIFGNPCVVTTPANPLTTNVIASQCGTTLASMSTTIYCGQVTAANHYRFEVTDGVNPARTFDSPQNRFNLLNLTGSSAYGTTYGVRVAMRFGSTWQDYGTSCNITTPASPGGTNIITSQCGMTVTNSWATIYANPVADAAGYRFEVTTTSPNTLRYVDRPIANFNLHQLAGGYTSATVYTVRVSILFNGIYQPFGSACNIITAAGISKQAVSDEKVFAVNAYPNPYTDTFKLDLNTSDKEQVAVKIYDMIGKLLESREVSVSELKELTIGDRYPSGVYNVIVSQGDEVKTLRIIKR